MPVSLADMNFATGALILALIIGLIISPLALIIAWIVIGIRKRKNIQGEENFWGLFRAIITFGAGTLTGLFIIFSIVISFIGN